MSSGNTRQIILVKYFIILFVFLSAIGKQSCGQALGTEYFDTAENCTSDTDCAGVSLFAICDLVNVTKQDPQPEQAFKCVCDVKNGYYKYGSRCYYRTEFDETCDEFLSVCTTKNAQCLLEGSNYSNRRCRCRAGYHAVKGTDGVKCAITITKNDDPSCRPCEANEGKCYASNNARLRDGCKCPSYRSGADCENLHLDVRCDASTFSMIICYEPHDDMPADARLYVFGYDTVRQCEALLVNDNNTFCKPGEMALRLPLAPVLREACGTKETLVELTNRRFVNKLVLQSDSGKVTDGERAFSVYCSFQDIANTKQGGLGVLAVDKGGEGHYKFPHLILRVENIFGNEIPEGTAVRLGDRVMFKFLMDNDGTFAALRVEHCTASSRATIPNVKSITCPMISSGCPDIHQAAFSHKNNFRFISGRPYEVESGLVNMFKLSEKTSFHMHCRLKICLLGHVADCAPVECQYPAFHYSAGKRRKRSASAHARYMMITREMIWYTDKPQETERFSLLKQDTQATTAKPTISVEPIRVTEVKTNTRAMHITVTVILVVVTVAVVIAAGVLCNRLRRRKVCPGKDLATTTMTDCTIPQRDVRSVPPSDVCDVPPSDVCGVPIDVCSVPPTDASSVPPNGDCSVPPKEAVALDDVFRAPPGDHCSLPSSDSSENTEQNELIVRTAL